MYITQENAELFVGKLLFAPHGKFHYYPLKVIRRGESYCVIDKNGTRMKIPKEDDGGIYFENAVTEDEYYGGKYGIDGKIIS